MNFWSEPEPWMILVAGLFCTIVTILVYPDPGWLMTASVTAFAVGVLIWMRIMHWWDFDE